MFKKIRERDDSIHPLNINTLIYYFIILLNMLDIVAYGGGPSHILSLSLSHLRSICIRQSLILLNLWSKRRGEGCYVVCAGLVTLVTVLLL